MKTARATFSATTALGLLSFTAISAFTVGVLSPITQIAFGLVAIHVLLEIAVVSYRPRQYVSLAAGSSVRVVPLRATPRTFVRVPAVIEYPSCSAKAA